MRDKPVVNPGALGLASFALTTFLLSVINTGLLDSASLGIVVGMGIFYGGMCQIIAGMWDFYRGDNFGGTAFLSYGALWLGLALLMLLGQWEPIPAAGKAVFLGSWGFFTLYMTIGALRISRAVTVVFAALTLLFFLLAIGQFNPIIHTIAGYEGLFTAFTAWYASMAIILNEKYGREIVPVGIYGAAKKKSHNL